MPWRRRWQLVRRIGNAVIAACAAAAVLTLCAAGYAMVPALGPALDPGHGAWASAAGGVRPVSQVLTLPGLADPATVSFDSRGIATISASSTPDAALALGYVHASFRLAQMDLARRVAEGRLAALVGARALPSDRFELRLGPLRTAQREWAAMSPRSLAAQVLLGYARGVNDYLAQARATGQWPAIFALAGVYPAAWTPVDSLAVQGGLTEELGYTSTPLDYALLERSLGVRRTMAWFPVLPVSAQRPYDPGPYRYLGVAPIARTMTTAAARQPRHGPGAPSTAGIARASLVPPAAPVARAAAAILAQTAALPAGQVHQQAEGNAWAASGPKVAGGGAMLAADPQLPQTLPSLWFEVAMSAPGFTVSGVSVPGLPGVVIGHNAHIAWSLTGTQNQSALFYAEQTSTARPGQYLWRGHWRAMRVTRYTITVRGGPPRHLTVRQTVHGPVLTQAGQTMSVDWMGNIASPDVAVLLSISQASNFAQFRAALANWRAPAQNFVFADDRGNIGAVTAGYLPVVRHGSPWLPMPGTGADDVAGVIPQAALPYSYDPPGHVIATASQRPVSASYPYYIGTTANDFDPSYRASREYAFLDHRSAMGDASFAALQGSLTDALAVQVLPRLLAALRHQRLPSQQREAAALLRGWNYSMGPGSAAASIWWAFWTGYLSATFGPWWRSAGVPVRLDRAGLAVSAGQLSLVQLLEHWTLADPSDPAFTPPGGRAGTCASVMRAAFARAVASLSARLHGSPSGWTWGRMHAIWYPSLTGAAALGDGPRASGAAALGYGPRAAGGDAWTVDASYGLPVSSDGPSWRMIIRWPAAPRTLAGQRRRGVIARASYPGGQSENPSSPWYQNLIPAWWNGSYLPMPATGTPGPAAPPAPLGPSTPSTTSAPGDATGRGSVRWELRP